MTAIHEARRGETYVPNAPAATIVNVAKALIGDRKIEIKQTGIRPGEKYHEIMVSDEEATRTVKRGEYYAILPMLPELLEGTKSEPAALKKEFSSGDNVLELNGTLELLKRHKLRVEDNSAHDDTELLR